MVMRASRRPAGGARRGVALLVALGVLVMLALVGSVFATLSGIERTVARNYIDKVRARLLAESGIEHAFAELGRNHGRTLDLWGASGPLPWQYYGLDLNANGIVDPGERGTCAIALPTGERLHDWGRVPIEEAARPSFPFDRNGNGTFDVPADLVPVDGRPVAVSGCTAAGNYAPQGNLYTLKVSDLQGRININNRHANLARILNALGRQLALSATMGDTIVAERTRLLPHQQFTNLDQLIPRLGRAAVERLRPYLTVGSWVDPAALKPVGLAAGRRCRDLAPGASVYASRELRLRSVEAAPPPGGGDAPDLEPRSPININTASFEVLCACLEGLQGFFTREVPNEECDDYTMTRWTQTFTGNNPRTSGQVGIVYQTPPLGPRTAENIAREILKARAVVAPAGTSAAPADPRSVFRSYQQLADFFDRLPDGVFDPSETVDPTPALPAGPFPSSEKYIRAVIKDVLKANFDPNVHLNELNPDETLGLRVDKTDLTYWTFEFCFIPMGCFEIESLGRLVDGLGRELACEKIVVQARLFDVVRDSTQADFQRDAAAAGAPPSLVHLAVYPEPAWNRPGVLNAVYDGYVSLRTKDNLPGGAGANLRLRYADTLDAEDGVRPGACIPDPGGGPWADRLVGGARPGCLMADGVLSELDTAPGYDNSFFNQHCGTVAFWLKPAFEPEYAGHDRLFWSLHTYDLANDKGSDWTTNVFGLGYLAHHGITTARNKREDHAQAGYGSGDGRYFWRSLIGGYAGAYRRSLPTWDAQADIDSTSISSDRTGQGIMADRIAVNASPTLNHAGHNHGGSADDPAEYYTKGVDSTYTWGNLLKRGRWIQVGMYWNDTITGNGRIRLYVNGVAVPWLNRNESGQNFNATSVYQNLNCLWGPPYGTGHGEPQKIAKTAPAAYGVGLPPEIGQPNKLDLSGPGGLPYGGGLGKGLPKPPPIRIGAAGRVPDRSAWARNKGGSSPKYPTNTPADATVDEVFTWDGADQFGRFVDIWKEGRFYRSYGAPDKGSPAGGTLACFTSSRFLPASAPTAARRLPPKGSAVPPAASAPSTAPVPPPPGAGAPVTSLRFGLVAYTLRVPDYARLAETFPDAPRDNATNRPRYHADGAPAPRLYVDLLSDDGSSRTSLLAGPAVLGYTSTDPQAKEAFARGGGAVTADATRSGPAVELDAARGFRYRFWLDSGFPNDNARLNAPYTASPVVDDVLVTYTTGRPEILSWIAAP